MLERHRILVVDDDALDRQAVIRALRREAAELNGVATEILEAETVSEAREALQREEFACVFLDHNLPDGTALDLLLEVRSQGLITPIVVLTGERNEQIMAEVMRAGAADFLQKEKLRPDLIALSLRAALRFLRVQREKQAVFEELRARDRAIASASNGIVIADPRLPDCPLIYTNEAFLQMTGYSEAEVIGRNCRFLQGPETDPRAVQELREAVECECRCQTLILNYRKDGTTFWNEITLSPVRDAYGKLTHFVGIQTDTTARQEAEAQRRQAEEEGRRRAERERFLVALADRARQMADPEEVISDAVRSIGEFLGVSRCLFADIDIEADTCTIHPSEYRADPASASIAGVVSIASFGEFVVTEYAARRAVVVDDVRRDPLRAPAESLAAYEAIGIRAHVTVPVVHYDRVVSCMSVHNDTPRHWLPEEVELLRTVVERTWLTAEVTRQEDALKREAASLASLLESITDAFVAFDTEWRFTYVNDQSEQVMNRTREELLGKSFWDEFPATIGTTFEREYRRAVEEQVTVTFEEFYRPLNIWVEVRAYPSSAGLSVFYQDVTARKLAEVERDHLLGEQQRLLAELRQRAEREALLNRIGQSVRNSSDPVQILETAVRELGEALKVDRCYYTTYDQEADRASVGPDWHRAGLPSLAGEYTMSHFSVNQDPVYKAGNTQVVPDIQGDAAALALGLRALIRVPLVSGKTMTALALAMGDAPRPWTADEVSLVEAVATRTQTALEAALTSRRERTIAQQLQNALQPALPAQIAGLSLGSFTQPALEEASVGGDFFDVFPLDKEQYALVIGDVSGKGLAAAQQLALIRNSLRTTLYLYRDPAQAVSNLNAIISAHDLLVGFVTAWVGIYDGATGQIAYASCGHEPGLIRRAGGLVEELETTGPPLGVAQNADYGSETITLSPGDALLLYTDGISEAGPSRRNLLGTAGLMRILAALPDSLGVQEQAETLVTEVSHYSGGLFRDDVAVLLAQRG